MRKTPSLIAQSPESGASTLMSSDAAIIIAFPKNRSTRYSASVQLAKKGSRYAEDIEDGKVVFHAVAFSDQESQLSIASSLLSLVGSIKGVIVSAYGKTVSAPFTAARTINCYLDSLQCLDSRDHCHSVIDSPFEPPAPLSFSITITIDGEMAAGLDQDDGLKYNHPCRLISRFSDTSKSLVGADPDRAASLIYAGAVRYGCNWCPNFHAESFSVISSSGSRRPLLR